MAIKKILPTDYRDFKTPFYRIEIGDPDWKRTVKLPHHISRLVEKVEIMESMIVDSNATPSQVSVTFVEGSREPASPDYNLGTSGLYQIPLEGNKVDNTVSGSVTNRSGLITDLRFSGSHGITHLTEFEKKTGKIDNRTQKNVEGNITTRDYKYEPKAPLFLFQERNKIKITWGYLEDPTSSRSIMMIIQVITTDFPQEGMPRTVVTGLSFVSVADQIATRKARVFGRKKITSKSGDSLIEFQDLKTDEVIRKIANDAGMAHIVSENLPNDLADKDKQKMWLAGESFHQFIKKMAELSGCYYEIVSNVETGKETILFIKYADFEKRLIISNKELLNWRGPGSILKSVSITADFGGMSGNQQKGFDVNGNPVSINDETPRKVLVQHTSSNGKKEQAMATAPNGNNPLSAALGISNNIANGGVTGIVENSPYISEKNKVDKAEVEASKQAKMITIDFNTIGYTKLIPGVMEITGIGVRYSGKYRINSVTHTIDSNGYNSRCSGTSQMLAAGGVTVAADAPKGEEKMVGRVVLNTPNTPIIAKSTFGETESDPKFGLKNKDIDGQYRNIKDVQ